MGGGFSYFGSVTDIRVPLPPVPFTVDLDGQRWICLVPCQPAEVLCGSHTEGVLRNDCHHLQWKQISNTHHLWPVCKLDLLC